MNEMFQYPLNLHCSQTIKIYNPEDIPFQYPLNLHCSQTLNGLKSTQYTFQYPLNLHCSQTFDTGLEYAASFNTL